MQSFFRFSCNWTPDTASLGHVSPPTMKTGRSLLKICDSTTPHKIESTKEKFSSAAKKETKRLGFIHFESDLVKVGNEARNIISLACTNFGLSILYPFLGVARDGNR